MEFEGIIRKDKKTSLWVVEVATLDIMTQGETKEDAVFMLKDAVKELLLDSFPKKVLKDLSLDVRFRGDNIFGLHSNNTRLLLSLSLRRQREREGLTIRDVSHNLESTSPNAYAQYERGNINISMEKFDRLLAAINPERISLIRVA